MRVEYVDSTKLPVDLTSLVPLAIGDCMSELGIEPISTVSYVEGAGYDESGEVGAATTSWYGDKGSTPPERGIARLSRCGVASGVFGDSE